MQHRSRGAQAACALRCRRRRAARSRRSRSAKRRRSRSQGRTADPAGFGDGVRKLAETARTRPRPAARLRATLNKSLSAQSSLFWAVCSVANPRHSGAMAVVCALQPIPNQGAHTREDLFSIALAVALDLGLGAPRLALDGGQQRRGDTVLDQRLESTDGDLLGRSGYRCRRQRRR
jgi:hypothetical protein